MSSLNSQQAAQYRQKTSSERFFNVMEGMDGKKRKFCGTPFSSDEVIYGHRSQMIKICNSYKMYRKESCRATAAAAGVLLTPILNNRCFQA